MYQINYLIQLDLLVKIKIMVNNLLDLEIIIKIKKYITNFKDYKIQMIKLNKINFQLKMKIIN